MVYFCINLYMNVYGTKKYALYRDFISYHTSLSLFNSWDDFIEKHTV